MSDPEDVWRFFNSLPPAAKKGWRLEQEGRKFFLSSTEPVCDFCSAKSSPWTVKCNSFRMPVSGTPFMMNSDTDWAACDDCKSLIEQGCWDLLKERVKQSFMYHELTEETMELLEETYDLLKKNMTGIVRFEPDKH